ncbi:hypothetical protein G6F24_014383 [Rhizopus arrhizus]|nr:hypothetical protein G6F24_014383 [Rhizopus arrhizus]
MVQARALRCCAIGLAGRGGGIEQQPGRDRAFAFRFAHEEAIRTRVQLPIDLAQLVTRLVGTVLREFQAGAAAAAGMLADAAGTTGQAGMPALTPGSTRERHGLQQGGDHVVGTLLLGLGGERQQQAVAHHRCGQRLHILAGGSEAALQQGACFRREHQRLPGTRAGTPFHPLVDRGRRAIAWPAGAHQAGDPGQHVGADMHLAHSGL